MDIYTCAHGKPFAVDPATGRIVFSGPVCAPCEKLVAADPPVVIPEREYAHVA